jgi:hypothetical protein
MAFLAQRYVFLVLNVMVALRPYDTQGTEKLRRGSLRIVPRKELLSTLTPLL